MGVSPAFVGMQGCFLIWFYSPSRHCDCIQLECKSRHRVYVIDAAYVIRSAILENGQKRGVAFGTQAFHNQKA